MRASRSIALSARAVPGLSSPATWPSCPVAATPTYRRASMTTASFPSIRRIADAVHGARNGCKVLAQITHTAPVSLAKLNCDDGLEGGTNIDTFPAVAAQVEKAGVAAIDVIGPAGNLEGESYVLKYAQKLRVKVPVILTGGNRNVDRLEQILQAGPPDFVAMARPFIREPDLAARWQARKGDPHAACISCNRCLDGFRQGKITRCRVNEG